MKKVIFYIAGSQEKLPSIIKENRENDLILIQLDLWLKDLPTTRGISLKVYKDYISFEDCLNIDKDAVVFSENWYRPTGKDFTKWRDYSLGESMAGLIFSFFVSVLKNIFLIQRVIEKESPEEFIIFDDKSVLSKIFLNFLSDNAIKFKRIDMQAKPYIPESFETSRILMPPTRFLDLIRTILQDVIWTLINRYLSIAAYSHKRILKPRSKLKICFDPYTGYFSLAERLFGQFDYEVFMSQPSLRNFKYINFLLKGFRKNKRKITFYPVRHNARYLTPSVLKEAREFPFDCWQRFTSCPECKQQFMWRGVNFWDAISGELRNKYFTFFSEMILEILYPKYIIQRYKLDIFLMPWDKTGFSRSFVPVAKKMGLHTMWYQGGIFQKIGYLPMPRSDKLLVWGQRDRNFHLKQGISPERIIMIGNPMIDTLVQRKSDANRLRFSKKLGLDPAKKIVLYAGTYFAGISALTEPYNASQVLLKLVDAANKLSDIQFLIKFHHSDDQVKEKIELIKNHSKLSNIRTFSGFDIYTLVANSDGVITQSSTVGIEAMLLNKPVIILKFRHISYVSPYEDGKGVVVVDREDDIVPTIKRLFTDDELLKKLESGRKEFLKYAVADFSEVNYEQKKLVY